MTMRCQERHPDRRLRREQSGVGNSIRRGAVGGNGHCVQRSSPLAVRSAHAPRLATLLLVLVTFVACAAATPAPSIEAVRWHASGDQVAVEWRVTPASTGQVEFGPTTAYGRSSELETSYLSAHVQQLTGLEPGMEYHFRVVSAAPDRDDRPLAGPCLHHGGPAAAPGSHRHLWFGHRR